MVLSKRVGAILREAREERKLSIKEVARETNITPKYIEALENEAYALGFLRNYSEYLNLDTDHILNLYRGLQIDQSQAPIEELIKTRPAISMRMPALNMKYVYGALAVILLGGLITLAVQYFSEMDFSDDTGTPQGVTACDDRELVLIDLPQSDAPARIQDLSLNTALKFRADALNIKMCLEKVGRAEGQLPEAIISLNINEEETYEFTARLNESVVLSNQIEQLAEMKREIEVKPVVIGNYSARLEFLTHLGDVQVAAPQSNCQVTLEFVDNSYIQWVRDGESFAPREMQSGQLLTLEAQSRLEIKVGNGGGVMIRREGAPPRRAGPMHSIVNISYRRVPDPLDPGIMKCLEEIQVAR